MGHFTSHPPILQRPGQWLGLILLALALGGCGFQLRTAPQLPASLSPLYIQGLGPHDELRQELESLFGNSSLALTTTPGEAASTLKISQYKRARRILSVDSRGKAAEYALSESLRFSLLDPSGTALVPEQRLAVERSYINSNEQVLGKQFEAEMLYSEMRRDLARRMLTRLNTTLLP